jgi:hypothetical protein
MGFGVALGNGDRKGAEADAAAVGRRFSNGRHKSHEWNMKSRERRHLSATRCSLNASLIPFQQYHRGPL